MSLLSINTKQLNKLSLKEVRLPAPKNRELKPLEAIQIEKPLTDKEIFYNRLITTYPLFKELVDTFDLIIE